MYLGRFLGVTLDTYQDTSRYIKIHQDTSRYIKIHVSWTLHQGVVLDALVRFPDGGWAGRFRFLCCMQYGGRVGRRGHPLRGGWSHSPPVGKAGDVDDT